MKFLSLISGKSVHIAPGVKRIPKADFSKLLNAEQLLEKIHEEAQELRQQIAKEGEDFFEESKKQGFEEGLHQWADQLKHLEEKTNSVKKDLQNFLVKIAMTTAKKVVGREIDQNPATIADMVMKNLRSVSSDRRIKIFANKADLEPLHEHKERMMKALDQVDSFTIQAREDIEKGGVVIETEAGIIDARAEKLWEQIEKALDELIHKKNT